MRTCTLFLAATILVTLMPCSHASTHPRLLDSYWTARWIACPDDHATGYGVYHFRRTFEIADVPPTLVVHVSADQRYKLWVNGHETGKGPARGDLANWAYESYDIAPLLRAGRNIIAAQVWNAGEERPMAQHSNRTAFVLQADQPEHDALLNTDEKAWRVFRNTAYAPVTPDYAELRTYIVVGPGDRIDGAAFPWGWTEADFDDSAWPPAAGIGFACPPGLGTEIFWQLVPRRIPQLEERIEPAGRIRRVTGLAQPDMGAAPALQGLVIPANTRASLLVDRGELTMGYPLLETGGGKGSLVRLTYAEAPVDADRRKGNRNEIEGKTIIGLQDEFLPGGGESEEFTTLWLRTYRYLQVDVETAGEPLTIAGLRFRFSAYPLTGQARFASDDPSLADIWRVGWRTARLCAGETYFDCPYYEQLQYVGDTRIQALISLYVAGDDRLMRNAIRQFEQSRFYEGLTRSRYPSHVPQVIPPYSLFWINMVHDYLLHRPDMEFVRAQRMGVITVLDWYARQLNESGLVGPTPYWNFVDWTDEWPWSEELRSCGVPDLQGGSSILTLQLVYALQDAAGICRETGDLYYADHYTAWAARLRGSVLAHCWDARRGLFADTPARSSYSQHANILAVLTGTVAGDQAVSLLEKVLADDSLIQATFYFKFYLFQALYQAGMADRYLEQLQPWRDMLALGLTTFAEKPDPTRSDCHAWSASPNYDLLATVCGIRPSSPGFATVAIAPFLGSLRSVEAAMPHPQGEIRVSYQREDGRLLAEVILPEGVTGTFTWGGSTVQLTAGLTTLQL